jgi:hypothetical protein
MLKNELLVSRQIALTILDLGQVRGRKAEVFGDLAFADAADALVETQSDCVSVVLGLGISISTGKATCSNSAKFFMSISYCWLLR